MAVRLRRGKGLSGESKEDRSMVWPFGSGRRKKRAVPDGAEEDELLPVADSADVRGSTYEKQRQLQKERDEEIERRVKIHPITAEDVFDLFSSKAAAYRRFAKLRKRKRIKKVGYARLNEDGRPQTVFCGWRPKADWMEHEILLSKFCLWVEREYGDEVENILRGNEVDKKQKADAELFLAGKHFPTEMDTGSMSSQKVKSRWNTAYRDCEDTVVVLTLDENRRKWMIERSEAIQEIAIFGVLDDVIENGTFVDFFGKRRELL